jgi:hypothetical protein
VGVQEVVDRKVAGTEPFFWDQLHEIKPPKPCDVEIAGRRPESRPFAILVGRLRESRRSLNSRSYWQRLRHTRESDEPQAAAVCAMDLTPISSILEIVGFVNLASIADGDIIFRLIDIVP